MASVESSRTLNPDPPASAGGSAPPQQAASDAEEGREAGPRAGDARSVSDAQLGSRAHRARRRAAPDAFTQSDGGSAADVDSAWDGGGAGAGSEGDEVEENEQEEADDDAGAEDAASPRSGPSQAPSAALYVPVRVVLRSS